MSLFLKKQREMLEARAGDELSPGSRVLGTMPDKQELNALPPTGGPMALKQLDALLDSALEVDLAELSQLSGKSEARRAMKRDVLLPKYRDYVARLTDGGRKHELIGYYLVWCIDALAFEEALTLAAWCLENGQTLPGKFKSTVPFFVADSVLAWANAEFAAQRSFSPYLHQALDMMENGKWDVPDEVRAGYYSLFGKQAMRDQLWVEAEKNLLRAMELGASVKTNLTIVQKQLAKLKSKPSQSDEQKTNLGPATNAQPAASDASADLPPELTLEEPEAVPENLA